MKLQVKKIVNVKESKDGQREFEVEWENSWESEASLRDIAKELIDNFLKGQCEQNNNDVTEDDCEDDHSLTIDEGMYVDEQDNTSNHGDGMIKANVDGDEEPVLTDLFGSSGNSTGAGKLKKVGKGGGINDIISRLQKNKQEERIDNNNGTKGYEATFPLSPEEATKAPDSMVPLHVPVSSQTSPRKPSTSFNQSAQSMEVVTNGNQQPSPNVHIAAALPAGAIIYEPSQMRLANAPVAVAHLQAVFKCGICSEAFYEDAKFKQHMFMHEQVNLLNQDPPKLLKPGTYECKFCREIFDKKEKLKIHYFEKHEKEFVDAQPIDQLYQCTTCDLTFVDYNKLLQHQQSHAQRREVYILPKQQIQPGTLVAVEGTIHIPKAENLLHKPIKADTVAIKNEPTEVVNTAMPSMTTLDFQPVNEVLLSKTNLDPNTDRKQFRCNICDELFETEEMRAKHSMIHVNRSSSLDCHICGKQFRHRTNLSTHMIVHSGVKPHQCHICLRRFTQKVNLQRHMHIHDGSRPFICRMCSKSFTQKANLQRHILSHTECSKEDVLQALNDIPNESEVNNAINESLSEAINVLTDNKRTTSDPTDKAEFYCDICDKIFAQKVNLQKHMLIHTGSRPFQCYICGKAFRQRSTLQKHYTIHTTGSSSFVCQTCNRLFVSKTNLQRHMLVHAKYGTNQCYLCDQKFTTTDNLERHFSEHIEETIPSIALPNKVFEHSTPGQTFRCAQCDVIFESPVIFSQHLKCHQRGISPDTTNIDADEIIKAYEENQTGPLQCSVCNVIFMSVSKLEVHMLTHSASSPGSNPNVTPISPSVVSESRPSTASSIQSNPPSSTNSPTGNSTLSRTPSIKQEEGSRSSPYSRPSRCPVCKEMFPTKESMRKHYSSAHIKNEQTSPSISDDHIEDDDAEMDPENEDVFLDNKPDVQPTQTTTTTTTTTPKPTGITENEERLIKENEDFIKDNILGGPSEYESKGRYERGNYSCKICNRVLTYKYSLEKHMLLHTGSFPHKCNLCSKRFNHKANLDKHLVVHSGEKPYVCHICQRPFSQKSNLQRHQLTHTQNRDFVCEVCGKRFNHMASLKTHSLIHTGAKPFACYVCNKRFNQKGNLKRHIATHKNGKRNKVNGLNGSADDGDLENDEPMSPQPEDIYNAEMEDIQGKSPSHSPSTTRTRSERLRVKKQMDDYEFYNDDDEPLPTMIGDSVEPEYTDKDDEPETAYDLGNVKEEIVTVMPSDALEVENTPTERKLSKSSSSSSSEKISPSKSYHCNSCSKVFVSAASLDAHRKNSHSQIICEVCGKQFSQKANLLKHKLIHANKKPFPCKICNKAFRQKANLQRHELIHNKDRKTVNCTECNKSFRCAWSLKQHMKNHSLSTSSDDFLFGCSICGKTFKEKEELQQHFSVHNTITLFSCTFCNLKFPSKDELLIHLKSHEEISTEQKEQSLAETENNIVKYEQVPATHVITLQAVPTAALPQG